jgi:hypothetical protein
VAVSVTGVEAKPEREGLVTTTEWIKLMNRMFDVISGQLAQLENLAKGYGKIYGKRGFTGDDARALSALSNTVKSVRVINDGINDDKTTEENQRQLKEGRAKQEEFERRLLRLKESGEDA